MKKCKYGSYIIGDRKIPFKKKTDYGEIVGLAVIALLVLGYCVFMSFGFYWI